MQRNLAQDKTLSRTHRKTLRFNVFIMAEFNFDLTDNQTFWFGDFTESELIESVDLVCEAALLNERQEYEHHPNEAVCYPDELFQRPLSDSEWPGLLSVEAPVSPHNNQDGGRISPVRELSPKRTRYECDSCGKTFSRKDGLKQNPQLHAKDNAAFQCKQCGKAFNRQDVLKKHEKAHAKQSVEREFRCDTCGEVFLSVKPLRAHVKSAHTPTSSTKKGKKRITDKQVAAEEQNEVKKPTELIEQLSLDGDEISLVHGPVITDHMSTFQAHFAEVTSKETVDKVVNHIRKNPQYSEATNIVWAYRILEAEKRDFIRDKDDGGEYSAGTKLLHLLGEINLANVVAIVTCCDGEEYLGLEKFTDINMCALNLFVSSKIAPPMDSVEIMLLVGKIKEHFEAMKYSAARHLAQKAQQKTRSGGFEILHSKPITAPKSSFQGHLARVTSREEVDQVLAQLKEDRKIKHARSNMWAYRIYDDNKKVYLDDKNDDGENKGGNRLLWLMHTSEVKNAVIIVTRWKTGDVNLGTDRFKRINACATEVIQMAVDRGLIETKASGAEQRESKKKGGKTKQAKK